MLASAANPSSQGAWKTRWSLADMAREPTIRGGVDNRLQPLPGELLLAESHQRQMEVELHPAMLSASRSPVGRARLLLAQATALQ